MLSFDSDLHEYKLDNVKVPSVTQVLNEAGIIKGAFYTDYARERGTATHMACEFHDQNDLDESTIDPDVLPRLEAWKRFVLESGIEILEIEKRVFSSAYQFAGTLDRFGKMSCHAILDIKTSETKQAWWGIQLAGYELALREMVPDLGIIKRFAVQLFSSGQYKLTEYNDRNDRNIFISALMISQWKRRSK